MLKITFDNCIRLPSTSPKEFIEEVKKQYTIINPEYKQLMNFKRIAQKDWPKEDYFITRENYKGRWRTRSISKYLMYWDYDKHMSITIPRSSFWFLKPILNQFNIKYSLIKNKEELKTFDFRFNGNLDPKKGQQAVIDYSFTNGIIQAPTGSGKTVMALYITSLFKVKTCITVDTNELANQWIKRIKQFLNVKDIGFIGGGKKEVKPITVALMQTLRENTKLLDNFDLLIVDECHIAATESYELIINNYKGKYVLGLSATPKRKDGKTIVMHWLLGKTRIKINYENAERCPAKAIFIGTEFTTKIDWKFNYQAAISTLINNDERNLLIKETIINNIEFPGIHLILSKSVEHLENLFAFFPEHIRLISRILVGKVNKNDRKEIVEEADKGKLKLIFATQQLLGRGFDESRLSVLHLIHPIKDEVSLTQFIGRITRVREGKELALIFDYFDKYEGLLRGYASVRSKLYRKLNIEKQIGER